MDPRVEQEFITVIGVTPEQWLDKVVDSKKQSYVEAETNLARLLRQFSAKFEPNFAEECARLSAAEANRKHYTGWLPTVKVAV